MSDYITIAAIGVVCVLHIIDMVLTIRMHTKTKKDKTDSHE